MKRLLLPVLAACFATGAHAADRLTDATLFSTELLLPLADGGEASAVRITGTDLGNGGFSWTGSVSAPSPGYVTLAHVRGHWNGSIHFNDGATHLLSGQTKNLVVTRAAPKPLPCAGCRNHQSTLPADPRQRRLKTWRNGDGNQIDLLIVYPAAVRTAAGNTAAVESAAAKAVADANLCFRNSLVDTRLRLVHLAEVTYTPSGLLQTDLDRLEGSTDGYVDDIHTLREQYGADLVSLLTTESDSGGLASTMQHPSLSFAAQAFSVCVWDQIGAPSYTLAHEVGHNLGCLHNREDTSNITSDYAFQAFSYGKRWLSGGKGYGTVMSYDTKPTSTYPNTVPHFSNPNVSHDGTATGNAGTEDNAQVLNFTSTYAANFRTATVQGIVASPDAATVTEGNATTLQIRLAAQPTSTVTVTASFAAGGDSDLTLVGPATLTFDSTNWNLPHPLQLAAKPDADSSAGTATLSLAATGLTTTTLTVTEIDTGTAAASGHRVSGVVTNALGVGLSGVTLTFSNSGGSATTDANGSFHHAVTAGWSGAVTPTKSGHTFSPASTGLSTLSADSTGHAFTASRSTVLYVNANATGTGDGSSWADAYVDLASALTSTHSFTEVWVAAGTYKPGSVRPAAFLLPPGVATYGGFAGAETARSQRNPSTNQTILSGDLGTVGVASDNAFHVVVPGQNSTLDGFTIRDGNASENYSDDRGKGGGLWAEKVAFTVSNCAFTSNHARQFGGAVHLQEANVTFTSCTFTSNTTGSTGSGGAIDANASRLTLASCSFTSNVSQHSGGALNSLDSTLVFTDSNFTSNQNASANGGGALNVSGGSLSDANGTYTSNSCAAGSGGGAIQWAGADANFTGSTFKTNQSPSYRGGALYASSGVLRFSGCLFSGNTSGSRGGALRGENVTLSFTDSNFTSNTSSLNGGALSAEDSNVTTTRCAFTSNQSNGNGGGACHADKGTWTDGNSSYASNQATHDGGAFLWEEANGTIADSNFTSNQNTTSNGGGALSVEKASPTLIRCRFTSNETKAISSGGAIKLDNASPSISHCVFTGNVASTNNGGAIGLNSTSSPTLSHNEFHNNSAATYGGALYVNGAANLSVTNSLFRGNHATSGGAVSSWTSSDLTFSNCRFLGNEANATSDSSANGGAVMLTSSASNTTFVNCIFSGNKANNYSGVLKGEGATRFVNCSFTGNSANYGGVSILFAGDSIAFENSILWGNSATTSGADVFVNSQTATASYSLFNSSQSSGTLSGSNNLSSDPLFTDADGADNTYGTADDDLSLQVSSPAIDKASASASGYATTDLLGKTRYGSAPDLGAYEYRVNSAPVLTNALDAGSLNLTLKEGNATVATLAATDADGDTVTFTFGSDNDEALFTLDASTGLLSFKTAPSHASPADADADNVYLLTVHYTDGVAPASSFSIRATVTQSGTTAATYVKLVTQVQGTGGSVSDTGDGTYEKDDVAAITATPASGYAFSKWTGDANGTANPLTLTMNADKNVTAVFTKLNNAPRFLHTLVNDTLSANVNENVVRAIDLNATDDDGDAVTFSLSGDDASLFDLNATTGLLTFKTAPDYELPSDGDANKRYDLTVTLSDGQTTATPLTLYLTLMDVTEITHYTLTANVDAGGSVTGAGQHLVDANATLTASAATGYAFSKWTGDLNATTATVTLLMNANKTVTAHFTKLNSAPVIVNTQVNGVLSVNVTENNASVTTLTATDEDQDTLSFALQATGDHALFDLNASTGVLVFKTAPDFENPADSGGDNLYDLNATVSDGNATSSPFAIRVHVLDDAENTWAHAEDKGSGWRYFQWFGNYFQTGNVDGWIYHETHGWLYRAGTNTNSVWLYDAELGWIWTDAQAHPYFFRFSNGGWLYYKVETTKPRKFYDYLNAVWLEVSAP